MQHTKPRVQYVSNKRIRATYVLFTTMTCNQTIARTALALQLHRITRAVRRLVHRSIGPSVHPYVRPCVRASVHTHSCTHTMYVGTSARTYDTTATWVHVAACAHGSGQRANHASIIDFAPAPHRRPRCRCQGRHLALARSRFAASQAASMKVL